MKVTVVSSLIEPFDLEFSLVCDIDFYEDEVFVDAFEWIIEGQPIRGHDELLDIGDNIDWSDVEFQLTKLYKIDGWPMNDDLELSDDLSNLIKVRRLK